MKLSFQYPVVYFYGDDYEDSEKILKTGHIEPIKTDSEPYEATITAEGYSFHAIFGSQCNGMFLCIPNWHMGCELASFDDVFWNHESIMGRAETIGYENATAIAHALKEFQVFLK